jgi:hypothetical protein
LVSPPNDPGLSALAQADAAKAHASNAAVNAEACKRASSWFIPSIFIVYLVSHHGLPYVAHHA